jgi:hypothetical protein
LFSPNHLGVSRDDKAKDAETATCKTTESKNGHHQLALVVCLLVSSILDQFGPRTAIACPRVRYLKNNDKHGELVAEQLVELHQHDRRS